MRALHTACSVKGYRLIADKCTNAALMCQKTRLRVAIRAAGSGAEVAE